MVTRTKLLSSLALGLLLGAGAVSAQPSWLRNLGPHDLCCGPKAMNDFGPTAAAFASLESRDILQPAIPALPQAAATVAIGPAASAPSPAATEIKPTAEADAAGVYQVTFVHLSAYEFVAPPDEKQAGEAEKQIPAPVKALDAKKVAVTGFMLPVKMNEGLVTEFLLVKDPMACCYGVMPKVNEWVVVRMNGKGVPPLMDVPITFEGTLKVGQIYEGGYLTGLYLLQGERRVESKG
ncbi:DUF3299 domain-containing protein [Oleiharenicola lentus]|uniref:DUF3299 domain-containing protein n=1 Tax=Oleiharenicola lentus TaxID=2508720 RepID=A0A4Q1C5H0_9BACT|nr:DUF3299 domain-containing protein [Oleiharenicola lentus]RXK53678.1 DUF3299 domain-containing protein [Oleiharenicola lentus]